MKTKLTQKRFKAPKKSACAMCKPHKRGGEDKKTVADMRQAVKHDQEVRSGE